MKRAITRLKCQSQYLSYAAILFFSVGLLNSQNDRAIAAEPNMSFSARVQVDFTSASADKANIKYDDIELRRAYFGFSSKLSKGVSIAIDGRVDDGGDIGALGAYLDWKPAHSDWKFRLGQFKTPMSLDESTSSRFISTLERAAFTDAIEINRRLGLGAFKTGKNHTFSAGVFANPIDDKPFSGSAAASARFSYTPVRKADKTLHLGTSIRYRSEPDDDLRYRQRPYAHIADRVISTGKIADADLVVGIETAFINKSVWLSAEYAAIKANCPDCDTDPGFNGYYLEAGKFWGGHKSYKEGSFARPVIEQSVFAGGRGVLALVARYDVIDLNDADTHGGDMQTLILGADWWLSKNTRVGLNYFRSKVGLGNRGSGIGDEFSDLQDDDIANDVVDGFILRAQVDF